MNKNILLIDSSEVETGWLEIFSGLSDLDLKLQVLGSDPKLRAYFKSKNLLCHNLFPIIRPEKNLFSSLLFLLTRPVLFFFAFVRLVYFKISQKIDAIVCFGVFEKLHFTRAAKLLKIKIIWIVSPGTNTKLAPITQSSLKRLSTKATVVCLDKKSEEQQGKQKIKNINRIKIGIRERQNLEQKSIFESLAKNTTENSNKKYFTIGTIQDLGGNIEHLERLLHASKKCLQVIPHIQLIIAGEGPEKKKIAWMAQKMEIANLVWFVGNHKNPQKWLNNFDLYISTCPNPKLKDLNTILLASLTPLSVIGAIDTGLDEFIIDGQTGLLVDTNDSEKLASAIIDLQQNNDKRKRFAQNGNKLVSEQFRLDDTLQNLRKIICE